MSKVETISNINSTTKSKLHETIPTWTITELVDEELKTFEVSRFDLQTRAYNVAQSLMPKALSSYPTAHPSDLESFLIDRAMQLVETFIKNVDNKSSFDSYCGNWLYRKLPEFGRRSQVERITDIRNDVVIDDGGSTVSFLDTIADDNGVDDERIVKTLVLQEFLKNLSPRHRQILLAKAEGLSDSDIANKLGVHRSNIGRNLTTISKQAQKYHIDLVA